jgi:hypothetical protein
MTFANEFLRNVLATLLTVLGGLLATSLGVAVVMILFYVLETHR